VAITVFRNKTKPSRTTQRNNTVEHRQQGAHTQHTLLKEHTHPNSNRPEQAQRRWRIKRGAATRHAQRPLTRQTKYELDEQNAIKAHYGLNNARAPRWGPKKEQVCNGRHTQPGRNEKQKRRGRKQLKRERSRFSTQPQTATSTSSRPSRVVVGVEAVFEGTSPGRG